MTAPAVTPVRTPLPGPTTAPADTVAAPRRALLGRVVSTAALAVLGWVGLTAAAFTDIAGLPGYAAVGWAALAGALLGALRLDRLVRGAAALLALWILIAAATPLAPALTRTLVRRDRPAADSGAVVDAVAVLGGGVTDTGLVMRQGLDRMLTGIALAQRTGRPLIVSVVHGADAPRTPTLADQRQLAALAGLGDRLWPVDSVHSTRDEAVRMAALAHAHGWHRVALVTSPAHSRRACATFEHAGLAVVCTPARTRDVDRVRMLGDWLYEQIGWAVYRARGWV